VKAKYDKLIFEGDLTPIKRWGQGPDIGKAVVAISMGLLPFSTGQGSMWMAVFTFDDSDRVDIGVGMTLNNASSVRMIQSCLNGANVLR